MKTKHGKLTKVFAVVLCVLMAVVILPFSVSAKYNNEYYSPDSTQYISSVVLYYSSDGNGDAESWLANNGWVHVGRNFNAGDGKSSKYVHMGVRYSSDPSKAIRAFRIYDGSCPGSFTSSINGYNCTFYVVGGGGTEFTPAEGDGRVDLNKGGGGNDIQIYATRDPNAGPPITAFDMAQGGSGCHSDLTNRGFTIVTDQNGGYQDCNEGQGGDWLFAGYYSSASSVNTNTLRSNYDNSAGYVNTTKYTASSVGNLTTARNNALTIMNTFDSSSRTGVAAYNQTQINNAANAIITAQNNLQIAVNFNASTNGGTLGFTSPVNITTGTSGSKSISLGNYSASKSGWNFLGWSTDSGATTGSKGNVTVTNGNTFYAIFDKKISFNYYFLDNNGALTSETITQTLTGTSTATSFACRSRRDITIDGEKYTFVGYREDTSAAAPTWASGSKSVTATSAANQTVNWYAVYAADIDFVQDAAKGSPKPEAEKKTQYINANDSSVRPTVEFTVTSLTPSYEGVEFKGWDTSADAKTVRYTAGNKITTAKDVTLYAVYDFEYYEVKFLNAQGEVISTQTIRYDLGATAPAAPAKAPDTDYEYVFTGWDTAFTNVKSALTVKPVYTTADHDYQLVKSVLPTCTKDGSDKYVCANCGTEKTEKVEKLGHAISTVLGYAPTCTNDGMTDYIFCTRCYDVVQAMEIVPSPGHDFELTESVEATCISKGYDLYTCSVCGNTYKDNIVDTYAEHQAEVIPAIAATCTANGKTEGSKCSVCGAVLVSPQTVIAKGHTPVTVPATKSSCTEEGHSSYVKCADCGANVTEPVNYPATEHQFEELGAIPATCTEDGRTAGKFCKVCGFIPEDSESTVIPATGHSYAEDLTKRVEATCSAEGQMTEVCSVCLDEKFTPIEKTAHTETTIADVEATCAKAGSKGGTKCAVCGEIIVEPTVVPAPAHTWVKTAETVNATCQADGKTAVYACSVCSAVKGGTKINMVSCAYGPWTVAQKATCTEDGLRTRSCMYCGGNTQTQEIKAVGHIEIKVRAIAATCEADGVSEGTKCAVCGEILSGCEAVTAPGHDCFLYKTYEVSCSTEGYEVYKCANCTYSYETEHTPALGHTEEIIPAVEPTCVSLGYTEGKLCSACGKVLVKQEIIAKTAHTKIEYGAVEATCTETGMKPGVKCEFCGRIYSEPSVLPVKAHESDLGTVTTAPTCTTEGVITYKCIYCGETLRTEGLGYGKHVLPAEYKVEGGMVTFTCDACGEEIKCEPTEVGLPDQACEKCGLHHKENSVLFAYNGLYCKLVGFFRSIFAKLGLIK